MLSEGDKGDVFYEMAGDLNDFLFVYTFWGDILKIPGVCGIEDRLTLLLNGCGRRGK